MVHTTLTRELLQRLLAGELEAERRLFDAHRSILLDETRRHKVFRRLKRVVTEEDVVQEVFWRSLSAKLLSRFEDRGRGSLAALLTTLLHRTLLDIARRSGAEKRGGRVTALSIETLTDGSAAAAETESSSPSPSSDLRARDLLQYCRQQLDEEEWTIWHAVEVEGLDATVLGRNRGVSASAIRARLERARQKLMRALRAEERRGGVS